MTDIQLNKDGNEYIFRININNNDIDIYVRFKETTYISKNVDFKNYEPGEEIKNFCKNLPNNIIISDKEISCSYINGKGVLQYSFTAIKIELKEIELEEHKKLNRELREEINELSKELEEQKQLNGELREELKKQRETISKLRLLNLDLTQVNQNLERLPAYLKERIEELEKEKIEYLEKYIKLRTDSFGKKRI